MITPVTQETFEREFNTTGLSTNDCHDRIEELLIAMRKEAGAKAGEWIAQNGHFNGDLDNEVFYHEMTSRCVVKVVVRCFGLPLRIDDNQARAVEACRRYFEHCERVSVTSEGKSCNSIEMAVRMALKTEARDSVLSR